MDVTKLQTIVGLLVVLSVASERLVEIVKGVIPLLNTERKDKTEEGWRRAALQLLAVGAGMSTAVLARQAIPTEVYDVTNIWAVLALGLLASGGSGFWNAALTYLAKTKDVKKLESIEREEALPAAARERAR